MYKTRANQKGQIRFRQKLKWLPGRKTEWNEDSFTEVTSIKYPWCYWGKIKLEPEPIMAHANTYV